MFRRSLVLALMVGLALMTNSDPVAAQSSDCADYISSGGNSNPFFGTLIGTKKITSTISYRGSLAPFPTVGGSISGSTTTEYWVGTYVGVGGGSVDVNCSDYTLI